MIHSIANNNENDAIILNLYVREKSRKNKSLLNDANIVTMIDESVEKNINLEISEVKSQENYMETYEKLFQDLQKNKVNRSWNNKSLTFTHKLKHEVFLQFLNDINNEKNKYENRCLVNEELLEKEYVFDQYHPVSVNNVLKTNVNDIFKTLYKNAIKENVFPLGDRQSNRYKSHNESAARVLHYEILPLIEKITNKKLEPTYTYTSFYVEGADLPSHTDRPECQFTVSFVVDKPDGANWNIYVDPKNQPVKNKGRCKSLSEKEDCISVDCDANGLMIFCGEDHAHFREKLTHEYYNILLLHYREC